MSLQTSFTLAMQNLQKQMLLEPKVDYMNSTVPVQSPVDVFSPQTAEAVVAALEELPDGYWYNRLKINSIPTAGTTEANYYFLGHNQMPSELRKTLWALAPSLPKAILEEVCVNRYEVGYGMPEHIDLAQYQYNMVVALCDNGDGVEIMGQMYVDNPGKGIIFPRKSAPHAVPAVKHKRYVIIFLYA